MFFGPSMASLWDMVPTCLQSFLLSLLLLLLPVATEKKNGWNEKYELGGFATLFWMNKNAWMQRSNKQRVGRGPIHCESLPFYSIFTHSGHVFLKRNYLSSFQRVSFYSLASPFPARRNASYTRLGRLVLSASHWIFPPVIKPSNWKSTIDIGVSIGKSQNR